MPNFSSIRLLLVLGRLFFCTPTSTTTGAAAAANTASSSATLMTAAALKPYGQPIELGFPNLQQILGVGGLAYDSTTNIWTVSSENIKGSTTTSILGEYPMVNTPRLYQMKLDFLTGTIDFVSSGDTSSPSSMIVVEPSDGLKLEDMDLLVLPSEEGQGGGVWLVSEANSDLVKTNQWFSKDFGPPDLNTYDPTSFGTSRLLRVDPSTGRILEEATVPAFAQWEPRVYNWDSLQCTGDRPFQGLHAVSIIPAPVPSSASASASAASSSAVPSPSPSSEETQEATHEEVPEEVELEQDDDDVSILFLDEEHSQQDSSGFPKKNDNNYDEEDDNKSIIMLLEEENLHLRSSSSRGPSTKKETDKPTNKTTIHKNYIMFVTTQAALYQDGPTPSDFAGSALRILQYDLTINTSTALEEDSISKQTTATSTTATYVTSYRYDTSPLTYKKGMKHIQKGARHFNALFGLLALDERRLLIVETEDYHSVGKSGVHQVWNRIFYVELALEETVDHCHSLLDCNITAPPVKRLIYEKQSHLQLDGIAWGPSVIVPTDDNGKDDDDGYYTSSTSSSPPSVLLPTIVLTFEDDTSVGLYLESYVFHEDKLLEAEIWNVTTETVKSDMDQLLRGRILSITICLVVGFVVIIGQIWWVDKINEKKKSSSAADTTNDPSASGGGSTNRSIQWQYKHLCLGLAMMNSFLVGGVTFGFSGMVLILRQEGAYSESCACGTFCAGQKEQLALVSTLGFAVAIGSRLFLGLFLDWQGPKATSVLSGMICFVGFVLLATSAADEDDDDDLSSKFLYAWLLLSFGGSGVHISGFHFSNLWADDKAAKKAASAGISAAFGASSAIFPLWQIILQFSNTLSLQSLAIGYSVVVFCLSVMMNFLVQPWKRVLPGDPMLQPDCRFWKKSWWSSRSSSPTASEGGGEDTTAPATDQEQLQEEQKTLSGNNSGGDGSTTTAKSLFGIMTRFELWGETLFYSLNLLLLTHFLSVSAQLLYEKGDVQFTSDPNNFVDFMYSRLVGWCNALGFLWFPLVQTIVLRMKDWWSCYALLCASSLMVLIILVLPVLEIQIIGMILLSLTRLMLFSFHHGYLLDVFGIKMFGRLNGISSLVAACVGLLSYPLQLFGLSTSFAYSFIPIGCGILLSAGFPFLLCRYNRRQQTTTTTKGGKGNTTTPSDPLFLVPGGEAGAGAGATPSASSSSSSSAPLATVEEEEDVEDIMEGGDDPEDELLRVEVDC